MKTRGTFACYKDHRRDDLVLEFPGEKDITSHVDFTALTRLAADAGFAQAGYTDQHHFIVALAEPMLKAIEGQPPPKFLRQLQTLMHPQIMEGHSSFSHWQRTRRRNSRASGTAEKFSPTRSRPGSDRCP